MKNLGLDASGNVYVTDQVNDRVQKFSPSGTFITKWGSNGSGNGQFNTAHGVAADSSGNIFVVDRSLARVQKFSSTGTYISQFGSSGSGNGQFSSARGLAIDSNDNIYVADTGNDRIQKFDSSGTFVTKWGSSGSGNGEFEFPRAIAVASNGNIYVGDEGTVERVQVFAQQWIPGIPTGVTGTAGNAKATVSWTAPNNGGTAITQYTVTASPGGATANTSGTSVEVTGLINGTAYTFTVTATNAIATSDASAASSAVSPVAPVTASGEVLTDLLAATSLNLQAGQVVGISASPINDLGVEKLDMPSVVYTWNAGSCGTLDSTTSRTPTFTASSSACSGTITVHASQGGNAQVPTTDRSISVNVAAPPATAVPTVAPVDPTVIPEIVPVGLNAEDVAVILPSTGGTFSVPQDPEVDAPPISIEIPGGAIESGAAAAVIINVVSVGSVAAPPPAATEGATSGTFRFGSTIIEIQWYDDTGAALDTFK
jgi:hypothetical protein